MKGLKYLLLTTIKNSINDLRKNPAKLVSVIIFVGLIILVIFSSSMDKDLSSESIRNIDELYAIILALYLFLFVMSSMNGLSSGASFYSMADINLLFSTPISSKKILIYGLIKQMGTSLWVGFFLIYQYAWLNRTYGLSFGGLLGILFGYCIVVFCSQLTAMFIYSFSSNDEYLQKKIKFSIIGSTSLIIFYILYKAAGSSQDMLNSAVDASNSFFFNFIPVAGWVKWAVTGILSSNYTYIIGGLSLIFLYILIIIYTITKTHSDFYEDVLQATEVSFSAITAKKEGKISDSRRHVNVGKTGINKGKGANVFFYKHLLENRRSGLFMIDKTSIIFAFITIAFSFFAKNTFIENTGSIFPIFMFATYMQVFSSSTGRWIRELTMPYVYMIPVNPFLKLIMISKENILKICIEAITLFVIIGVMVKSSPLEIAVCIIARIGFGILFMSGNILTERLLGSLGSKMMILFLYFIIMILLALPGIIIGIIIASSASILPPLILGLLITFIWNMFISSLVIFFCKDILNYAELNNK